MDSGGNGSGIGLMDVVAKGIANRRQAGERYLALKEVSGRFELLKAALRTLPAEVYNVLISVPLPESRLRSIEESFERVGSGMWSVFPMVCAGGVGCSYGGRCGLAKEGLAPIGQDCPLEGYLIGKWMGEYVRSLAIDVSNKVQMDQVGTLVTCDLMIMRARNYMARKVDGHIDESAVGIDNAGNVILRRDIAKEILIEEKYQKLKSKVLEELLATRESRAKYDVVDDTDASVRSAKLRYKAQQLKESADVKAERLVKKAEFIEEAAKRLDVSAIRERVADVIESVGDELGDNEGDE